VRQERGLFWGGEGHFSGVEAQPLLGRDGAVLGRGFFHRVVSPRKGPRQISKRKVEQEPGRGETGSQPLKKF